MRAKRIFEIKRSSDTHSAIGVGASAMNWAYHSIMKRYQDYYQYRKEDADDPRNWLALPDFILHRESAVPEGLDLTRILVDGLQCNATDIIVQNTNRTSIAFDELANDVIHGSPDSKESEMPEDHSSFHAIMNNTLGIAKLYSTDFTGNRVYPLVWALRAPRNKIAECAMNEIKRGNDARKSIGVGRESIYFAYNKLKDDFMRLHGWFISSTDNVMKWDPLRKFYFRRLGGGIRLLSNHPQGRLILDMILGEMNCDEGSLIAMNSLNSGENFKFFANELIRQNPKEVHTRVQDGDGFVNIKFVSNGRLGIGLIEMHNDRGQPVHAPTWILRAPEEEIKDENEE